jgi:predicted nucleotidyltransferase
LIAYTILAILFSTVGGKVKTREPASTTIEVTQTVLPILQRSGATRAGLFGSLVHGRLRRRSDIDILVELSRDLSLLDVIGIQQELEDALGRKVDLVSRDIGSCGREKIIVTPRISP